MFRSFRRLAKAYPIIRKIQQINEAQAKVDALGQDLAELVEDCTNCGRYVMRDELLDESTQEKRFKLCRKCVGRRVVAHESGWYDWPNREN